MKPQTWQERVDDEFRTWNKGERQKMKDFFAPELQRAREEAVEEATSHLEKTYGNDGSPALVIIENLEGSVEQRPALPEVLTALKNITK